MHKDTVHQWVLLLLVLFISVLFLSMIRQFIMAIFLASIFSALAYPLYHSFTRWFGGRRSLASITTIFLIVVVVLLPLVGLGGIIAAQAIKVGETVKPWVQQQLSEPDTLTQYLNSLPFIDSDKIAPYRSLMLTKAGEMVGHLSGFLINGLSSVTLGTVNFLFMTLMMLYTMFFFLMDGDKLLERILYYLPLEDHDERLMLERFTSVTRATLKGTAVIGILQGALAGLAFAVAGIPSAAFWGAIMTVLSIIPGVGSALVWAPAAVILAINGYWITAIALVVFCAAVIGSLDNILRPILVGKDTQMHELMIFFGTLGGIVMFGVVGIIIGPIIAALFTTIWDIYAVAFRDILPTVILPISDQTPQSTPPEQQPDHETPDNP